MKVLHLINSLNTGGAEKLILDTLPIFNQKGINTDLLLLNDKESPFYKQLEEKQCCQIYSLGEGSVYNPLLVFKLISFLKKYDLIHAHLFPSLYWLALAKAISFSKTKIVYTEHNTNNKRRGNWLLRLIDRFIYHFYDKIITIAETVDANLKQHLNFKNSKFKIIHNGINTKIYDEAKPYKKSKFFTDKSVIIIQVSSFRKQKDQSTLIKSLKYLPEDYKLLLVGEGPLLEINKNLVNRLDLTNRVQFLGNRMDVPKLLKTSDVVVLSSHHEGLSLSSIEAMASGRPFIASEVPGLIEVVKDAGVLFKKEDVKELAKHILKLMSESTYYSLIARQCIDRAAKYDINKMVSNYLILYKNILAKPAKTFIK